ncbi:MAG TPA: ABC transporter transmembrane domain-containing protein, partial [Candidatus Paceibacterota bacterium]
MKRNYKSKTPSLEEMKLSWRKMFKAIFFLLEDKKKAYIFYSVFLIIVLFYDLVPAYVVSKVVDFFSMYTPDASLVPFYSYAIFLAVTWGLISQIRLTLKKRLTNIQSEVTYQTRVKGFERLLDFSLKWHDAENTGNKVQKIQQGTDSMKTLQKLLSNDIFPQITTITGVLAAFFFLNFYFFIFGLAYLAVFLSVQIIFYKKTLKLNYEHNTSLERASGSYYEGLSNVLTIKTLGVKDDFKKNIRGREEMSKDFALERVAVNNKKWKLFQIVNALAIGTVLILAGHNFLAGAITIGSLFMVYTYFQKLSGTMADSTQVIDDLISCKVGISRMMPIFWDESVAKQGALNFPKDWQSLSIQQGFFRYHSGENETRDSGLT